MKIATSVVYVKYGWCGFEYASEYEGNTKACNEMSCKHHRFKIINDPVCVCMLGPQTTDHIIWECEKLRTEKETLKNRIIKAGGDWPLSNSDLANKST